VTPLGRLSTEPTKIAFSLAREFREFALKGSVVDLAVGVMIGAAFGKVIESLVKNVMMPLVSVVIPGDQAYSSWTIPLGSKVMPIGLFLGDVVNFLIVALALFILVVKFLGWMQRARQQEAVAPPPPTKEEQLLMEIRDLLRDRAAPPAAAK
jgi:large conductance mechanosensitive channel